MAAAAFQNILDTSRDLLSSTNAHSFTPRLDAPNRGPIPSLPSPIPIVADILAEEFPPTLTQKISQPFYLAATKLHAAAQLNIASAVSNYPGTPSQSPEATRASIARMIGVAQRYYEGQLSQMIQLNVQRAHELLKKSQLRNAEPLNPHNTSTKRSRRFNQEYTPLLEQYFEINPFPSALDRALLARKSLMTPRQIEVWFQNHRNRARKDGKPVRRISPDELPTQIPLASLEVSMTSFVIPAHERLGNHEIEESDDEAASSFASHPRDTDFLNISTPPHAFPTRYEESPKHTTFIHRSNCFPCLPITWMRKPAPPSRKRKLPIGIDELCSDFMGMSLCGPNPKKSKPKARHPAPSWFAYKQTIPTPAPHPALIRPQTSTAPVPVMNQRSSGPPQAAHQRAFQLPVLDAPLATLIPRRSPRKVAPLPKRMPKYASRAHCGTSPAASVASSSPPPCVSPSTSCPSSFSSTMSSRRRLSSSSCSSTTSSTLTTPLTMHAELPEIRGPFVTYTYSIDDENHPDSFSDPGRKSSPLIQRCTHFLPGPAKLLPKYDFVPSPYYQTPSP